MIQHPSTAPGRKTKALSAALFIGLAGTAGLASAQVTFDVIGPHEYDLPVGFKPFNVFVQYAALGDTDKVWNASGKSTHVGNSSALVGLSKYVHFWTPESNSRIGLAYEVILPEVGIRNSSTNTSNSGLGDPLTGPAIWYKPTDNSTLGFQSFMQLPIGNKDIGGGDVWKNYSSFFWDIQMDRFTYTADAGVVLFGKSTAADARPGTIFHTNQRVGYKINDSIQPFLALDYEQQNGWTNKVTATRNARGHETTAGFGVMFSYYGNQSLTLRYSKGIDGENHGLTDTMNLKYVYAW